jgi:hypothetical protein
MHVRSAPAWSMAPSAAAPASPYGRKRLVAPALNAVEVRLSGVTAISMARVVGRDDLRRERREPTVGADLVLRDGVCAGVHRAQERRRVCLRLRRAG